MKRLMFFMIAFCGLLHSQSVNPTIIWVTDAPTGSCTNGSPFRAVFSTGALYSCQSGTWGEISGGGGGSGTVTSVTSGNLSPLFTTSVANGTTTPAISYTLSTVTPHYFFAGPNSGSTAAAPTYRTLVDSDVPGTLTNKTVDGVSPTTFGYLDATSSIQTQLNAKANSGTFGQSSATNAAITATNIVASVSSTPGMYKLDWVVSLTAAGTDCTGSTVVTLNDIFTDPSAASATTNPAGVITIAANGNGTVGYIASGSETILAKNATAIQYSTAYAAGNGCTTDPTYQVSYVITQIH